MAKVTLTSKFSAMKSALPVLASVLILASCSTAYKSGQTPDDVYYSPERSKAYAKTEKKKKTVVLTMKSIAMIATSV